MPSMTFCSALRISGWSSMRRTRMARSLGEASPDRLGDADRLLAAFALHPDFVGQLGAAVDALELEKLEVAANAAAARHRRREADLVEAVVDPHPHIVDADRARGHLGQQRQRHEAVRD